MIILHATINIKPGKRDEAIPIFLQREQATRKEEGCIEYKFVPTLKNPDVLQAARFSIWKLIPCSQPVYFL